MPKPKKSAEAILELLDGLDAEDISEPLAEMSDSLDSLMGMDEEIETEKHAADYVNDVTTNLTDALKAIDRLRKHLTDGLALVKANKQALINHAVEGLTECPDCGHRFRPEE